jgi:four helix bundle protein
MNWTNRQVKGEGRKVKGEKIQSFEDLEVYQRLCQLHLEINEQTLKFPKFELYELGSQIRRSSNSAPANIAEGWNNRHINIYLEGINRAMGELQETLHHLNMAYKKGYFSSEEHEGYRSRYMEAARMLRGLERSLMASGNK